MGLKSPGLRWPSTFHKLPEGLLENLTTEQKLAIVSRHFVTGVTIVFEDDLISYSTSVETFGGENLTLLNDRTNERASIYYGGNYIPVVTFDVMASNGVIHVIDKGRFFSEGAGKISQFFIQVILFEINCTILYTNLHELFCQFIS